MRSAPSAWRTASTSAIAIVVVYWRRSPCGRACSAARQRASARALRCRVDQLAQRLPPVPARRRPAARCGRCRAGRSARCRAGCDSRAIRPAHRAGQIDRALPRAAGEEEHRVGLLVARQRRQHGEVHVDLHAVGPGRVERARRRWPHRASCSTPGSRQAVSGAGAAGAAIAGVSDSSRASAAAPFQGERESWRRIVAAALACPPRRR